MGGLSSFWANIFVSMSVPWTVGASGGPWAAWGSLEYALGACSDRGRVSLVGARGGGTFVLGRIMVWGVCD